jgi:hypothetical protein
LLSNCDWGEGGLYDVARGELVFDLSAVTGPISAATLRAWLQRPVHISQDDAGHTTIYIVEGVNATLAPALADYGLMLPNVVLGSAGVLYADVLEGGSYHDIALNATGISWLVPGALSSLGLRINGDISALLPLGMNDVEIHPAPAHPASLTLTYANSKWAYPLSRRKL